MTDALAWVYSVLIQGSMGRGQSRGPRPVAKERGTLLGKKKDATD